MDFSLQPNLNLSAVEDLRGVQARAAFTVNSASVFKEENNIVPVIVHEDLSYIPWGGNNRIPYNILELIEKDETNRFSPNFIPPLKFFADSNIKKLKIRLGRGERGNFARIKIRGLPGTADKNREADKIGTRLRQTKIWTRGGARGDKGGYGTQEPRALLGPGDEKGRG